MVISFLFLCLCFMFFQFSLFIYHIVYYVSPFSDALGGTWSGSVTVPASLFPPGVDKFNLYAIHNVRRRTEDKEKCQGEDKGKDKARVYEALFPVPGEKPNFHRIQHFGQIPAGLAGKIGGVEMSDVWKNALLQETKGKK